MAQKCVHFVNRTRTAYYKDRSLCSLIRKSLTYQFVRAAAKQMTA